MECEVLGDKGSPLFTQVPIQTNFQKLEVIMNNLKYDLRIRNVRELVIYD